MIYNKVSDRMVKPDIFQLTSNVYAAKFEILKIVPAKYIIERALADNRINENTHIVETSSGTFALGLGIVCAENKLPFTIFGDDIIDDNLKRRLESLGGVVELIKTEKHENPQIKRLEALHSYRTSHNAFWPQQYDNIENRHAYHDVANYVCSHFDGAFDLVCAVGSGASSCGLIEGIRKHKPDSNLIGVDTFNSVLFGLKEGKRSMRGLGNSLQPKNLEHQYFDEIHWLEKDIAHRHTFNLNRDHGLFCGPTSGATYAVATYLGKTNPDKNYLVVLADCGHRYIAHLEKQESPFVKSERFSEITVPQYISDPLESSPPWSAMRWGRKQL